ncbi:MAG: hypothetical protein L0H59_10290 [Tomitella sp.]|nr:hypothetical protein [Tomitella sp.]
MHCVSLLAAAGVLWLVPADPPRERRPLSAIALESDVPGIAAFTVMLVWAFTASIGVLVIVGLMAAIGVPYGIASIASNQGMYASTRRQDSGTAAGILRTSHYLGAISATAVIGVVFADGATPPHWGRMVPVMVGLAVLTLVLAIVWRPADGGGSGADA